MVNLPCPVIYIIQKFCYFFSSICDYSGPQVCDNVHMWETGWACRLQIPWICKIINTSMFLFFYPWIYVLGLGKDYIQLFTYYNHQIGAQWQKIVVILFLKMGASLLSQTVKNLPATWKTWVWSLGGEDALEKEMATHSRILAWKITWTEEEAGGLQFKGSQRVRQDWVINT